MIDVFIVAELKLLLEGLAGALGTTDDLRVIETAARCCVLRTDLATYGPAVLLVDLASLDAATALMTLRATGDELRVVVLGVPDSESDILACAEAGAAGYLARNGSIDDLVATIRGIAQDRLHCPPHIVSALVRRVGTLAAERRRTSLSEQLTRREMEILNLINDGLSNREIAGHLSITTATVKNHVHNILGRLDVSSRAEASALARERWFGRLG
jgi:two-component system, NarL family, nitrate/nitrite response regulator NarL